MTDSESSARISLVGTGTRSLIQLTPEAEETLRTADRLYVLHVQGTVRDYLRENYDAKAVNLLATYAEEKQRGQTYQEIADIVIEGAAEGLHVALVTSGHPTVLVTPAQLIRRAAEQRSIPVEVIPGISALDTVWADLRFDPGPNGVAMFEATSLLLRQYPLDPTVPLFLWQPNTVETALHSTHKSKPERFERLRKYLEQYYPADHQTRLVHSASYSFTQPQITTIAIGDLGVLADVATSQHILYIPPVQRRPIADEELAAQVESVDHLHAVIHTEDSSIP